MKLPQNKNSIALCLLSLFVILQIFYSDAAASVNASPTYGWQFSAPEKQGMQSKVLLAMMKEVETKGYNIQSVTIVRNGRIVLDAYIYPFEKGKNHEMYSATKSVTSALIGIAIDKGYIKDVNQTITQLFPAKKISNLDELKKSLTLKDLLMMASGLDCNDGSANQWAGTVAMRKSNDWTQYTLNLPMAEAPGGHFHYCNGVSHLLSAIIHNSTGMQPLDFAKKHLFDPLGIKDIKWIESPEGIVSGFSGLGLQPQDMAKIGLLYLNKGKWENKQIISAEWIEESTRPYFDAKWNGVEYGYQWWINPAGYYSAVGMFGQAIYVVPDKNLVAVVTGDIEGKDMYISGTLIERYILPAIVSSEPLPPNPTEKARLDEFLAGIAKAPTQGIIWLTQNEGNAKDGIFKRSASPSFQFEYPLGCIKTPTREPDQIMRMETPAGGIITASVYKIPRDRKHLFLPMKLEYFGPKVYASWLKEYGSDITILSNEEIMLKCGTKAYRTDIKMLLNHNAPMTTNLITAYKDGKSIYIAVHQFKHLGIIESIIQSLRFE